MVYWYLKYPGGFGMTHETFIKKFNAIDYRTLFSLSFDITILEVIHFYLFADYSHGGVVRYDKEDVEYHQIQKVMKQVFELLTNYVSTEEYILECIRLISIIYFYQPFFDGNSRTCLCFLKILLEQRCMILHLDENKEKINREILSVFYTPEDTLEFDSLHEVNHNLLKRLPPKKED